MFVNYLINIKKYKTLDAINKFKELKHPGIKKDYLINSLIIP